jgi:hypothetical protein
MRPVGRGKNQPSEGDTRQKFPVGRGRESIC